MKSTILIHLFALPAVLAALELDVVVQESGKDATTVAGRRKPDDKNSAAMTHNLFPTGPQCLVRGTTYWMSADCPGDQPRYLKAAEFIFEGSIREVRPFRITTPDYTQPVS
jgi:hypothetical protein